MVAALNLKRLENSLKNSIKKIGSLQRAIINANYLFVCMHFTNKHRSSVSADMLEEFKSAHNNIKIT